MTGYFIIRLGADSEEEIKRIDAINSYISTSFSINIVCKQVPKGVASGDVAIIWLGTNNNKGGKTPWLQGVRAIGRIESVRGDGGYSSPKEVRVFIGLVLPRSVTKMDIVLQQNAQYADIAAMPVLGVNNYSSQVVQRIEPTEPGQSLTALFLAIDGLLPGMRESMQFIYPDLYSVFDSDVRYASSSILSIEPEQLEGDSNPSVQQKDRREVDDDGLEPDEDRDSEIEVPFDPTKIDIVAKPMTISSLEDRLDNDELDLTPDFQRQANVWDVKRKARLIESILLKIPLPSFYFSEDYEGGYAVVDGLQRLCAVFHFKNAKLLNSSTGATLAPLRLRGLQYLKELEGKTFDDLDRKFQRRISELEITVNIIRANTPSAVKFNVFARLNQGGMPLNAQEIRNAIFPGAWRDELRRLAEDSIFIKATGGKIQTSRQQDIELVLRFVALWQLDSPYQRPNNQTLDEFLNTTVEQILSKWSAHRWVEAGKAFFDAIRAACKVRGKHAFRKSVGEMQRKPINRGLFEAELIVFGSLSCSDIAKLAQKKNKLENEFHQALSLNREFILALLYGTGSAESSNARITAINQVVLESLDA